MDKYRLYRYLFDRPMGSKLGLQQEGPLVSYLSAQAVDYPVIGVDVSAWQGDIDWPKLSTKVYFAFIRAGRGNNYRDSYMDKNVLGARQTGRAYGLYWYMTPRTTSNFKEQVDLFVNIWKDSGSQLPPVMDFEETQLDKGGTAAWFIKAATRFKEQTDIYPMVYTSKGWWDGHVARNDVAKQCLLWTAHWNLIIDEPLIPNDWGAINNPKTWTFWQRTSKLIGSEYGVSSKNLDGNVYKNSLSYFNTQFNTNLLPLGDTPPPPPPPPTGEEIKSLYSAKVNTNLNPRSLPNINGEDFGVIRSESIIPIVEEKDGWGRSEYWVSLDYLTKL